MNRRNRVGHEIAGKTRTCVHCDRDEWTLNAEYKPFGPACTHYELNFGTRRCSVCCLPFADVHDDLTKPKCYAVGHAIDPRTGRCEWCDLSLDFFMAFEGKPPLPVRFIPANRPEAAPVFAFADPDPETTVKLRSLLADFTERAARIVHYHRLLCPAAWTEDVDTHERVMVLPPASDLTKDCLCGWKLTITATTSEQPK